MTAQQPWFHAGDQQSDETQIWYELYRTLRPSILAWVYSSGVPSWHGQEGDVTDDILQEAIIRTLKYSRLVERGAVLPIHSLTGFSKKVAHNYFMDLRRKDIRLIRFMPQDSSEAPFFIIYDDEVDPSETATTDLYRKHMLELLARLIADFPPRQRTALLTDVANQADFGDDETPLQCAFRSAEIELRDYQRPLPITPAERSRHAASLCIAYKRLKQTFHMRYRDFIL